MMIYNSSDPCIQKRFLCDIKLVVINKSYLLNFVNIPRLIDIIPKENELWDLVMGKMHIDI